MNTSTTARTITHRRAREIAEGWQDGRSFRSLAMSSTGSIYLDSRHEPTGEHLPGYPFEFPIYEYRTETLDEGVYALIRYYRSCFYEGMPIADRRSLEMIIRYVERYGFRVSRPWDACQAWDRYHGSEAGPDPIALVVALDAITSTVSDHEDACDRAREALARCTQEQLLTALRFIGSGVPALYSRRDLVDWLVSDADRIATERGAVFSTDDN